MRSTPDDFALYSDGTKEPSYPELDRLVTLIVEEQKKIINKNRELLDKIRHGRDV